MFDWEKAVLRGEDIKDTLKKLEDHIDLIQEDKEDYRQAYIKVRDEKYKDEEVKRLKEELDFQKRNSLVILSDEQKKKAKEFQSEHYKKCKTGHRSFVYTVTPTSIGSAVELKCPVCGEILDITDYDKW